MIVTSHSYILFYCISVLKIKGSLREKMAQDTGTMTPRIKAAVQVLIQSPSSQSAPSALLTPSIKRSTRMLAPPMPTPQRMHHKIPHRFVNGLNARATKCAVCLGSVHFVKQAAKCQGQSKSKVYLSLVCTLSSLWFYYRRSWVCQFWILVQTRFRSFNGYDNFVL